MYSPQLVHFFASAVGESGGDPIHPEVLSGDLRKEMELQGRNGADMYQYVRLLKYLSAVFVNPDQLSGFGTPWEIGYEKNYTLLAKGGNVEGYSSLISFIPDLKLGNLLMSYTL